MAEVAYGMTRFPEIFPGAVIELMRAGELTGDLEHLTQLIADTVGGATQGSAKTLTAVGGGGGLAPVYR